MTGVIALGQSAHYIQAWKIFVTQSASDMSLLSYSIYFTLLLHAFGYSILINKKLLMFAECHTSVILGQLSGNNISYTVPPHRQLKSHICN